MQEKDYKKLFEQLDPSDESVKSSLVLCKTERSKHRAVLKPTVMFLSVCFLTTSLFIAFYDPQSDTISADSSYQDQPSLEESRISSDESIASSDEPTSENGFKNGVKQLSGSKDIIDKINEIIDRNNRIKESFSFNDGTQYGEGFDIAYGSFVESSDANNNDGSSGGASMATPSFSSADSNIIQNGGYLKYSGKYIYRMGEPLLGDAHHLRIFEVGDGKITLISKTYVDRIGIKGILIYGNVLTIYGYLRDSNETFCDLYDVSDPTAPKLINEFVQEGRVLSCTEVDGKIYMITSYHINVPSDDTADEYDESSSDIIDEPSFDEDDLVPEFNFESVWEIFPIYITEASQSIYHTVISLIDLNKNELISGLSILGNINNVYLSPENLYLFETYAPEYAEGPNIPTTESAIYKIEFSEGKLEITSKSNIIGNAFLNRNIRNNIYETEDGLNIFSRAVYANVYEVEYEGKKYTYLKSDTTEYVLYSLDKQTLEVKQYAKLDFKDYINEFIYDGDNIFLSTSENGKSRIFYLNVSDDGTLNLNLSYETDYLDRLNMLRTSENSDLYYAFSYFGDGFNLVNPPEEDGLMISLLDFTDPYDIKLLDFKKINYKGYTFSTAYSQSAENHEIVINPITNDLSIIVYDHIGPEFLENPAYYRTIGIENKTIALKSEVLIGTDNISNRYVRIFLKDDYCYLFNRDYAFVIDCNSHEILSKITVSDRFED